MADADLALERPRRQAGLGLADQVDRQDDFVSGNFLPASTPPAVGDF